MSALTAVLVAVFTVGGATAIRAIFWGTDLWRSGTQRTEARAIQSVERYGKAADRRAAAVERRLNHVQNVADYWRNWAGSMEYVIRTKLGDDAVPPKPPLPVAPEEIPESAEDTKMLDGTRPHDEPDS